MRLNRVISTIDAHTAGEPFRVITGGLPPLPPGTILEQRRFVSQELDDVRRLLMYEPRGHHGMYGGILTPPVSPGADLGVIFMHNEGYSTGCGHGTIALTTVVLETGMVQKDVAEPEVLIDTPSGLVRARALVDGDRVRSVTYENVPAFLLQQGLQLDLPGLGSVTADIAFGGAFYALVAAEELNLTIEPHRVTELQEAMAVIKAAVERAIDPVHPLEPELRGIYGVIFSERSAQPGADWRNICVFADRQIDRSPCGTGTAARLAHLHAIGQMAQGDTMVHESIIGTRFVGRILGRTQVGPYPAVITEITGSANITGFHQFAVDPTDPLADGFLLR